MSMSHCLESYLRIADVEYDVVAHGPTQSAYDSARAAHLPAAEVVKSVLLKDKCSDRYVMALLPASHRLKLRWVNAVLGCELMLAAEPEIDKKFPDCASGAVPGFGQAYLLEMIWHEELGRCSELYFEAGSHEELIHIGHAEFEELFHPHAHGVIGLSSEIYSVLYADESSSLH
jgi:Ala-tRNA(Pro) deacylase